MAKKMGSWGELWGSFWLEMFPQQCCMTPEGLNYLPTQAKFLT